MRKILSEIALVILTVIFVLNINMINSNAKTDVNIDDNNIEKFSVSDAADTFDVKTIVPEVGVIIVATGVLLYTIRRNS